MVSARQLSTRTNETRTFFYNLEHCPFYMILLPSVRASVKNMKFPLLLFNSTIALLFRCYRDIPYLIFDMTRDYRFSKSIVGFAFSIRFVVKVRGLLWNEKLKSRSFSKNTPMSNVDENTFAARHRRWYIFLVSRHNRSRRTLLCTIVVYNNTRRTRLQGEFEPRVFVYW